MALQPASNATGRHRSKRLQMRDDNKENNSRLSMFSPLRDIISTYKMTDRRRTEA